MATLKIILYADNFNETFTIFYQYNTVFQSKTADVPFEHLSPADAGAEFDYFRTRSCACERTCSDTMQLGFGSIDQENCLSFGKC